MADEIEVQVKLTFSKGGKTATFLEGATLDMNGSDYVHKTQEIGTSEEALDLGDVSTSGYLALLNNDSTNYIEIRPGSGLADMIRVGPGEPILVRLAQDATVYAIADTAAVEVVYLLIED